MENGHGVVVEILPPAGRQLLEDFLRAFIPRPPKVTSQTV